MTTINKKNLRTLTLIVEAGFSEDKAIAGMGLAEVAKLPRECRIDIENVLKCQNAVKTGKLLTFLVEESKEEESHEA